MSEHSIDKYTEHWWAYRIWQMDYMQNVWHLTFKSTSQLVPICARRVYSVPAFSATDILNAGTCTHSSPVHKGHFWLVIFNIQTSITLSPSPSPHHFTYTDFKNRIKNVFMVNFSDICSIVDPTSSLTSSIQFLRAYPPPTFPLQPFNPIDHSQSPLLPNSHLALSITLLSHFSKSHPIAILILYLFLILLPLSLPYSLPPNSSFFIQIVPNSFYLAPYSKGGIPSHPTRVSKSLHISLYCFAWHKPIFPSILSRSCRSPTLY